jgi:hypothetical protein
MDTVLCQFSNYGYFTLANQLSGLANAAKTATSNSSMMNILILADLALSRFETESVCESQLWNPNDDDHNSLLNFSESMVDTIVTIGKKMNEEEVQLEHFDMYFNFESPDISQQEDEDLKPAVLTTSYQVYDQDIVSQMVPSPYVITSWNQPEMFKSSASTSSYASSIQSHSPDHTDQESVYSIYEQPKIQNSLKRKSSQSIKDLRLSVTRFSKEVLRILFDWLVSNSKNPKPTPKEKQRLMNETGLNKSQLDGWFINARRRYWKDGFVTVDVNKRLDC